MELVIAPNPILRTVAQPVDVADAKALKAAGKLAKQMAKIMHKNDGVGLAAPQVGVSQRIIVIDFADFESDNPDRVVAEENRRLYYLINPEITDLSAKQIEGGEGCLSFPGISINIARSKSLKLSAYNLEGQAFSLPATKLFAIALQHEIDHLNGITLFEHVAAKDKVAVLEAYSEALASGAKPGQVGEEVAN